MNQATANQAAANQAAIDDSEKLRLDLLRWSESGEDYDKALALAVTCAQSADRWLRINALHCFGYIARVHGRLHLETVMPILREAQSNASDAEVAAAAQDALDDLEVFLPEFTQTRA